MTGYISGQKYFKKNEGKMEINQKRKQVFEKTGMTYDYSEHNEQEFNFTFPVIDKFIEKNATMYLHIEFEADYRFKDELRGPKMPDPITSKMQSDAWFKDDSTIVMHRSVPLIKFGPKEIKKKMTNLLGGEVEKGNEEPEPESETTDDDEGILEGDYKPVEYIQYLKPELYCYISPDFTLYPLDGVPDQMKNLMKLNTKLNYYEPLLLLTDFWLYQELLIPLNKTVSQANVTVKFQTYSMIKAMMMEQFEQTNNVYSQWGMESNMDMTKKMFSKYIDKRIP